MSEKKEYEFTLQEAKAIKEAFKSAIADCSKLTSAIIDAYDKACTELSSENKTNVAKADKTSKQKYDLTHRQVMIIANALCVYQDELELKLTDWEIKEEGKKLIKEFLKDIPALENKFKDF